MTAWGSTGGGSEHLFLLLTSYRRILNVFQLTALGKKKEASRHTKSLFCFDISLFHSGLWFTGHVFKVTMAATPSEGNLFLNRSFNCLHFLGWGGPSSEERGHTKLGRPKAQEERACPSHSTFIGDSEGRNPETAFNSLEEWQAGRG